jgi:hypothetical protein
MRGLRARWVEANSAQRSTLIAAAIVLFVALLPGAGSTAHYTCLNPETGLPTIIAGERGDTASEIASRYCSGDVAAAQRALEASARVTDDTILHGAILRLPNNP